MRFFQSLLLGLLLSTAFAAHAGSIVVFGDSISAAYGLELQQGWVSLLEKKLQKHAVGKPYRLINASVSGETTSGGLSRLPAVLSKYRPDIVILELGGNDGLRGQPPTLMADNLRSMIAQSQKSGAKVLLLGMKIPPNYGKAYTTAFEQVFPQLAREHKVALVPFLLDGVGGQPALMQDDGIHPNAAAQPKLVDNVWPQLSRLLSK